jgi:hypothetical protein
MAPDPTMMALVMKTITTVTVVVPVMATAPTMIVLVTKRAMPTVAIPVMALVQAEVVLKCGRLQ